MGSFASHLPYQPTTSYSNCRHSLITLSTTYHHHYTHTHTHTHSHHVRAIRSPPTARHRPSPIPLRPRLHPSGPRLSHQAPPHVRPRSRAHKRRVDDGCPLHQR